MRITLDKEKCIGCGTCESICPSVFELGDDMKAHLKGADQEKPFEEKIVDESSCAEEAADSCAVQAIEATK